MKQIVLARKWEDYRKGTKLKVLAPREAIVPRSVDRQRAERLVEIGIAQDAAKKKKPQEEAE